MHKNSKIFEYRKLRDFEKVLFLEKQVKTLIEDLKKSRFEIGVLKSELYEALHKNPDLTKIINQRKDINNLKICLKRLKLENERLLNKVISYEKER